MLRGLDRLLYRVSNVPAAARYWRQTWDMQTLREADGIALLKFADGTGEVLLHNDPDLPGEGVFLLVDDVRQLYAEREHNRLTFMSKPSRVARGYRTTVRDPFGTVLMLLDRCEAAEQSTEDARGGGTLFPGVPVTLKPRRTDLVNAYLHVARTADDLPYTPHFERVFEMYQQSFTPPQPDRSETWRHLLNLRKGGHLPKLGEARSRPPNVEPEERDRLREIVGSDLTRRDRLPYTDRFDTIADAYNKTADRRLSPHQLWRLVATLAK